MTRKTTLLYLITGFVFILSLLLVLWLSRRRPAIYGCSPAGQCQRYPQSVISEYCFITFLTEDCGNQCGNPLNHCGQ